MTTETIAEAVLLGFMALWFGIVIMHLALATTPNEDE